MLIITKRYAVCTAIIEKRIEMQNENAVVSCYTSEQEHGICFNF